MATVEVSRRTLQWALNRSSLSETDLKVRFPALPDWLAGTRCPTLRQLERLGRATGTPLGFLFLREPPEDSLPIPHLRTLGDAQTGPPSPDFLETVQSMQRRQAWMREYLVELGHTPLPFVGSVELGEQSASLADRMREALGLNPDWASFQPTWREAIRTLCQAMERIGILPVMNGVVGNNTRRKLNLREFRGFVLADEYAPLVFVNGRDAKGAQMFTLAHELAHVFFGESAAFDLHDMRPSNDIVEQACNSAAAEFLVPQAELRRAWPSLVRSEDLFPSIARRFKVSRLVGARRALDLRLIDRRQFTEFYETYKQEPATPPSTPGGGSFYANQQYRIGRRFASAVFSATLEGRLLFTEAYDLTGLRGAAFDRYAESLGFSQSQL